MRMRSSMYVCMYLSHVRDGSGAGAEDMHALHASAYPWNGAAPGLGGKRVHACTLTYLYTHTHTYAQVNAYISWGERGQISIDRSVTMTVTRVEFRTKVRYAKLYMVHNNSYIYVARPITWRISKNHPTFSEPPGGNLVFLLVFGAYLIRQMSETQFIRDVQYRFYVPLKKLR